MTQDMIQGRYKPLYLVLFYTS